MTISQSRMIDLISAGTNYENAYNRILTDIYKLYKAQPSEQVTSLFWTVRNCVTDPEKSSAILHVEREHFRRNARRNELAARKAKASRAKQGISPRREHNPSFEQMAHTYRRDSTPPMPTVHQHYVDWALEDLAKLEAAKQEPPTRPLGELPIPGNGMNEAQLEAAAIARQQFAQEDSEGVPLDLGPAQAKDED